MRLALFLAGKGWSVNRASCLQPTSPDVRTCGTSPFGGCKHLVSPSPGSRRGGFLRKMGREAGLLGVITFSILLSCMGDWPSAQKNQGCNGRLVGWLRPVGQPSSGMLRRLPAAANEWGPSFQPWHMLKVLGLHLRGGSDEWGGDEDASSEEKPLDRRRGADKNTDRHGMKWGGEVEVQLEKDDTSRIERELRRRDKVDVFCKKTGLNIGVARTLLMQVCRLSK